MPTLDDARQALKTARANLEAGDVRAAGNRAYYAIFYAATAVIAAETDLVVEEIKTHEGLRRMFHLHLVKPGRFPQNVAGYFTDVQLTRWAADYTDDVPISADIDEAIDEATAFVTACAALVEGRPT